MIGHLARIVADAQILRPADYVALRRWRAHQRRCEAQQRRRTRERTLCESFKDEELRGGTVGRAIGRVSIGNLRE